MPCEEEAVVEKRVVPTERMCLGTDSVTAKRKGLREVRKEQIEFDEGSGRFATHDLGWASTGLGQALPGSQRGLWTGGMRWQLQTEACFAGGVAMTWWTATV